MYKTIINFCPTGMVPTKATTPYVPVSPDEIIDQTHRGFTSIQKANINNLKLTYEYTVSLSGIIEAADDDKLLINNNSGSADLICTS